MMNIGTGHVIHRRNYRLINFCILFFTTLPFDGVLEQTKEITCVKKHEICRERIIFCERDGMWWYTHWTGCEHNSSDFTERPEMPVIYICTYMLRPVYI